MVRVFGIKNCDTVKKAISWLNEHNVDYQFFDVKTCGLTLKQVEQWRDQIGVHKLINKRSTTWKQLTPDEKDKVLQTQGLALVLANPTLIKRPLIEFEDNAMVGFNEADYSQLLTS